VVQLAVLQPRFQVYRTLEKTPVKYGSRVPISLNP
jgi:hypothetical protein